MKMWQLWEQALLLTEGSNQRNSRRFDLSCLFEDLLGVKIPSLKTLYPELREREIPQPEGEAFLQAVKGYSQGEPLQYLLGKWEFYGMPFFVGPGVLIPRPDTETLVERGLALLQGCPSPRVMDLCAGTGCVSIALGAHRPDGEVWAVELSKAAFGYMERNIRLNQSSVKAVRGNVLEEETFKGVFPSPPLLDLVVSNPPYISRKDMEVLERPVTYEPSMALEGGEDGLHFYRVLPSLCYPLLRSGGFIAFEVGYDQGETVAALLGDAGYQTPEITRDLEGIQRVVSARKP